MPDNYYLAAVMMLFYPVDNQGIKTILTRRTDTLPTHQGQISFPGGKMQAGDKVLLDTATRETREELGIKTDEINIMGRLDDAWSSYGHLVIPFVGWLNMEPEIDHNKNEVAEVVIADVQQLMLPETSTTHRYSREGRTGFTHAFDWDGGYVWGMTADLLLELFLWVNGKSSNRGDLRLTNMKLQLGIQ